MSTLADFLLARIAEDEAVANAAAAGPWSDTGPILAGVVTARIDTVAMCNSTEWEGNEYSFPASAEEAANSVHIARWDPTRVLAECEAKRRIVDWVRHDSPPERGAWLADDLSTRYCGGHPASYLPHDDYGPEYCFRVDETNQTLRLLALPYAKHPDFRPEWHADLA